MICNKAANSLKISYCDCWERQLTPQHADSDAQPNFLSSRQQTIGELPFVSSRCGHIPMSTMPLEVILSLTWFHSKPSWPQL